MLAHLLEHRGCGGLSGLLTRNSSRHYSCCLTTRLNSEKRNVSPMRFLPTPNSNGNPSISGPEARGSWSSCTGRLCLEDASEEEILGFSI